ncbi:hypothetical protein FHR33_008809 [Nonomuraea dietziae]|uniref:Uncharacterized protein n=1 Tax=Nonomuraea dietziae TaxID=65515 RepID=A0A7W5YSV4_9ACTN|nr:hypothetical protein [Nonomuraea dietziae]
MHFAYTLSRASGVDTSGGRGTTCTRSSPAALRHGARLPSRTLLHSL